MKAKNLAEWRQTVLERDNHTCQKCGRKGLLQAHHIKQVEFYPELELETDNGKSLCFSCHRGVPAKRRHYGQYPTTPSSNNFKRLEELVAKYILPKSSSQEKLEKKADLIRELLE